MALQNASVVTDPTNLQIVKNGGPSKVQELVASLGTRSDSKLSTKVKLSSGVELISKPSHLNVPPWQMVSVVLGGSLYGCNPVVNPKIYTTTQSTEITCWNDDLGTPGSVEIATTRQWTGKTFGLTVGSGSNFNRAKLGVSTTGNDHYSIFGDMNRQGAVSGERCSSSQNGRGGLFYVINDPVLFDNLKQLISGSTTQTASSPR